MKGETFVTVVVGVFFGVVVLFGLYLTAYQVGHSTGYLEAQEKLATDWASVPVQTVVPACNCEPPKSPACCEACACEGDK